MFTASTRTRRSALVTVVALLGGLVQLTGGASSATADQGTSIEFESTKPIAIAFGQNWSAKLVTKSGALYDRSAGSFALTPRSGTVDVYVSGVPGVYVTGLPIQFDGAVYVSPPAGQPPLAPGSHELSAIYNPSPESGSVVSAQTTSALTITVSSFALKASISVEPASKTDDERVVSTALYGEYVDSTGAVPPGTWFISVKDKSKSVFTTQFEQPSGKVTTIRVPVAAKLRSSTDYTVTAKFEPAAAVASGLTISQPGRQVFRTDDGPGIAVPIELPVWLLIVLGVVIIGLAAAGLALLIRNRGSTGRKPEEAESRGTASKGGGELMSNETREVGRDDVY